MQNNLVNLAACEKQPAELSQLRNLVRALIGAALLFAVVLLVSSIRGVPEQTHGYLSSLPLALAGFGYALLQIALHPGRGTLLKRLLLAATFVAWAVDQVMPAGKAAVFVGDMVIAAYVLDLYWVAQDQIKAHSSVAEKSV
jgi:hypothetical protein